MKKGDFLTCKRNFYADYSGKTFLFLRNFFKKPIFKKGEKYEIELIEDQILFTSALTYSTSSGLTSNLIQGFKFEKLYIFKNNIKMFQSLIDDYFYSIQEERNLKLKKLKKCQT